MQTRSAVGVVVFRPELLQRLTQEGGNPDADFVPAPPDRDAYRCRVVSEIDREPFHGATGLSNRRLKILGVFVFGFDHGTANVRHWTRLFVLLDSEHAFLRHVKRDIASLRAVVTRKVVRKRGEVPKPVSFAQSAQEHALQNASAGYVLETSVVMHLDQIGERIRRLVDMFENRDTAAEVAGRSTDALNRWMKGETDPAFSALARMAKRKGVSLEWLANGTGEMSRSEFTPDDGYVFIPRYEVRASAGSGQIVEEENLKGFLAFQSDWIRSRLRRNPANLVVLEAYGDSMRPTIKDGDIMLVDISEDRVRGPAIYVVRAGNEAIVKRVELKLDGSLLVKSDNPAYEAMTIRGDNADELRIIGKVVWTGGVV